MSSMLVQVEPKKQALCQYNGSGTCRYCGADVLWVVKPDGHKLPVNPSQDGDLFRSHFETCADRIRNRIRRGSRHVGQVQRKPGIDHETGEILDG